MHISKQKEVTLAPSTAVAWRRVLPPQQDLSLVFGTRTQSWRQGESAKVADCFVGGVPRWSASMGNHLRQLA